MLSVLVMASIGFCHCVVVRGQLTRRRPAIAAETTVLSPAAEVLAVLVSPLGGLLATAALPDLPDDWLFVRGL
jgi:hypothetical protein